MYGNPSKEKPDRKSRNDGYVAPGGTAIPGTIGFRPVADQSLMKPMHIFQEVWVQEWRLKQATRPKSTILRPSLMKRRTAWLIEIVPFIDYSRAYREARIRPRPYATPSPHVVTAPVPATAASNGYDVSQLKKITKH